MPVLDWDDLNDEQQNLLLTCPSRTVEVGCEVLSSILAVTDDLSDRFDNTSGDVEWTGASTVRRGCSVTLALDDELAWDTDLLRLSMTITDDVTGLAARAYLGVFVLAKPDKILGAVIQDPASQVANLLAYQVTGQDRVTLLNRLVGASYSVTAGTNVLTAIGAVFMAAGLTGVLIDTTATAATVPTNMVWALVASDTSSEAAPYAMPTDADPDAGSGSDGITWLQIINDLLALISYRGVWADDRGYFRCTPYAPPDQRPPTVTFDADDPLTSTVGVQRTISRADARRPNKWIGIWANMPADDSGNEPVPTVENGGVYVVDESADQPGRLVWPVILSITAASAADVIAQVQARVASDKRDATTFSLTTAPYPAAGHYDIATLVDSGIDAGTAVVQATGWQLPLTGADMTWTFEKVV